MSEVLCFIPAGDEKIEVDTNVPLEENDYVFLYRVRSNDLGIHFVQILKGVHVQDNECFNAFKQYAVDLPDNMKGIFQGTPYLFYKEENAGDIKLFEFTPEISSKPETYVQVLDYQSLSASEFLRNPIVEFEEIVEFYREGSLSGLDLEAIQQLLLCIAVIKGARDETFSRNINITTVKGKLKIDIDVNLNKISINNTAPLDMYAVMIGFLILKIPFYGASQEEMAEKIHKYNGLVHIDIPMRTLNNHLVIHELTMTFEQAVEISYQIMQAVRKQRMNKEKSKTT